MSSIRSRPLIIAIEGNIGAGKSTIIDTLGKQLDGNNEVILLKEPVDIWESIKETSSGENILEKFYKDSAKYAFSFQVMAYVTRLSLLRDTISNNPECKVIICERSLDADRNIFAKMLYDDGLIEDIHYQIYLRFYNEYVKEYCVDGIVYIDADADVCYNRIKKRSRDGESNISLDYLEKCKKYYDEWLDSVRMKIDILDIDANYDTKYNMQDANDKGVQWLLKINNYINTRKNAVNKCDSNNPVSFIEYVESVMQQIR